MSCVEVRDRLTEHALGLLEGEQLRPVERHLEWCAGCRKESAELLEGMEALAGSLTPARPPASLEDRVVREVLSAAGKRPPGARRRTVRVLAVATLAAGLTALGAVGWGFAERQKAQNFQEEVARAVRTQQGLTALVDEIQSQFKGAGRVYQAFLFPGPERGLPGGAAIVFAAPPGGQGFVVVDIASPLSAGNGPFLVELTDRNGHILQAGSLTRNGSGRHVLQNFDLSSDPSRPGSVELSHLVSLNVVTPSGHVVLTGAFRSFVTASPAE